MSFLPLESVHIIALDRWRKEVDKLPERKKCKWNGAMISQQGVRAKVRFNDGYFQIKKPADWFSEYKGVVRSNDGWYPMVPSNTHPTYEQMAQSYGHEQALEFGRGGEVFFVGEEDQVGDDETAEGLRVQMSHTRERIQQNHTGNHYRNKKLRIPTAPGEPVRG